MHLDTDIDVVASQLLTIGILARQGNLDIGLIAEIIISKISPIIPMDWARRGRWFVCGDKEGLT